MNMEQFCAEYGVSKTTIYRRIKEAGLELAALRGEDGTLTPEACSCLAALLDGTFHGTQQRAERNTSDTRFSYAELVAERDTLRVNLETALAKVESLTARCDLLEAALESERKNSEQWRLQAERAQQLHALELQRLLPEKVGIIDRIRGFFK